MKTVCEICDEYCRRLDVFVGNVACLTRTHAQKLIASGGVTVNGKVVTKCAEEVTVGDEVSVTLPDDAPWTSRRKTSHWTLCTRTRTLPSSTSRRA